MAAHGVRPLVQGGLEGVFATAHMGFPLGGFGKAASCGGVDLNLAFSGECRIFIVVFTLDAGLQAL